MLNVKQEGIKYLFRNFWYDLTWDRTLFSQIIGEHSIIPIGRYRSVTAVFYPVRSFEYRVWMTKLNTKHLCRNADGINHFFGRLRMSVDSFMPPSLKWPCVKCDLAGGWINIKHETALIEVLIKRKHWLSLIIDWFLSFFYASNK